MGPYSSKLKGSGSPAWIPWPARREVSLDEVLAQGDVWQSAGVDHKRDDHIHGQLKGQLVQWGHIAKVVFIG